MSDDRYLWDGSGEPDPEVRRLEEALAPLRHRGSPETLWAHVSPPAARAPRAPRGLAAAAVLLATLGVAGALLQHARPTTVSAESIGERLETGARSHARIRLGEIGTVEVGPRTRLRVLDRGTARYRLALDRGSLRAVIFAPPGDFLVDTPSARAVDLGCVYTLSVDDGGAGLLTVESGWVAFAHGGRESFVPAGARCATRPRHGPGLPYYLDAPAPWRRALAAFEATPAEGPRRRAALGAVLAQARARDVMTLWHLLARVSGVERGLVYDRMAALLPPPPAASREAIVRGDAASRDAWWNELGLGSVDFWRRWKAAWSDPR